MNARMEQMMDRLTAGIRQHASEAVERIDAAASTTEDVVAQLNGYADRLIQIVTVAKMVKREAEIGECDAFTVLNLAEVVRGIANQVVDDVDALSTELHTGALAGRGGS